ncbi:MAG TPA: WD40 repeat domain-containing protein, partial [Planctomycetota bacterium]|nr:WD40 repeat domain-containing protein [Planctomycetota bacterium]
MVGERTNGNGGGGLAEPRRLAVTNRWFRRNAALAIIGSAALVAVMGWLATTAYFRDRTADQLEQALEQAKHLQAQTIKATAEAEQARGVAEWQSYLSQIRLATIHLESGRPDEADAVLAACPERWRGWEWDYLQLRLRPVLLEVPPQGTVMSAIALSGDGRRLICESAGGAPAVHDVDTGAALAQLLGHEGLVHASALSADGRRAVTGSRDRTVRIWDAGSGALLSTLTGPEQDVLSVAISGDAARAACASGEPQAWVWDVASGKLVARLAVPGERIDGVALSGDGRRAATASTDLRVRVWDLSGPEPVELHSLPGHTSRVGCVALSSDGDTVASGSGDRTLRVWDARSGANRAVFRGHEGAVRGVALSGDGERVASSAEDRTIRLWGVAARQLLAVLPAQAG